MKKESKLLLGRAVNSLILSIEHFNRPFDCGRVEAVLILLDHSFEMLLKAAILHRDGKIREKGAEQTIGFDSCVRKALTGVKRPIITEEQALSLQIINSLRDAAQHHLVEISEDQLYIHAQAGLTLFRDLLVEVFDEQLSDYMPERVLPVSMSPPTDLATLFDREVAHIQKLLSPKTRKKTEAMVRAKSLAIVEGAVQGLTVQPSDLILRKTLQKIKSAKNWADVFPGVSVLNTTSSGSGPSLDLRITKKEGIPVHLVPEGTPGSSVVAVKRVDELSFYSLSHTALSEKIGISKPKLTAVIRYFRIKEDATLFKQITISKSKFDRFSMLAIDKLKNLLSEKSASEVWQMYNTEKKTSETQKAGKT